jgi:trk system potassium uptake protein TrkA
MARPRSLYVVIVGRGRLGSYLASQLSQDGHSVVVTDHDGKALEALHQEYGGFRIEGDAAERPVLRRPASSCARRACHARHS